MIFDTDVLIWCFRGNKKAATLINKENNREISVVNYMEIIQGALNKKELNIIRSFLREMNLSMLPLSENISARAAVLIEEYALSSELKMADALIAATAIENHSVLCTGNIRHYKAVARLKSKSFRP